MKLGKNISKSLAKSLAWSLAESPTQPVVWDGLVFTPVGNDDVNPTVTLSCLSVAPNCEYSTDGRQWTTLPSNTPVEFSEPILVRGLNEGGFSTSSNLTSFRFGNSAVAVSGDVTSLINQIGEVDVLPAYCFTELFADYSGTGYLVDASTLVLPSSRIGYNTYKRMFYKTAITKAPALPLIQVSGNSLERMFEECKSLTDASAIEINVTSNQSHRYMFFGCTSLVTPPSLPCMGLGSECYSNMFSGCTSLVTPPVLPATNVNSYCYLGMFQNCKALTSAPVLNAVYVGDGGYRNMFMGCTSLVTPPVLPCTNFGTYVYAQMFRGCTNLTTAPVLPATTMKQSCYEYMFFGTAITTAPALPAMTLAKQCYDDMFDSCMSLVTAPDLPATDLAELCYKNMFHKCANLKGPVNIAAASPNYSGTSACVDMFYESATATGAGGTINVGGGTAEEWASAANIDTAHWNIHTPPPVNYLMFTSTGDSTVGFYQQNGYSGTWTMQYSTNAGSTWNSYTVATSAAETVMISLSDGQSVYFRGQKDSVSQTNTAYRRIKGTGSIHISGDLTCLLNNNGGVSDLTPYGTHTFHGMFGYSTFISSVDGLSLPSTTLTNYCYRCLFTNHTTLVDASGITLPNATLARGCCEQMFCECRALKKAPTLSATTLAVGCYEQLFYYCTNLTGPVNIAATSPYSSGTSTACSYMFYRSGTASGCGGVINVGGSDSATWSSKANIDTTKWTINVINEDE